LAERALRVSRELGDVDLEAKAHLSLSQLHGDAAKASEASDHADQAVRLAREAGNRRTELFGLLYLQTALTRLDQDDRAVEVGELALSMSREMSDPEHQMWALQQLGRIAFKRGEVTRADELYSRAAELASKAGYRAVEANARGNLAVVARRDRQLQRAHHESVQALSMARELRHDRLMIYTEQELAKLELDCGLLSEAAERIERVLAHPTTQQSALFTSRAHADRSTIWEARGDLERAIADSRSSLDAISSEASHEARTPALATLGRLLRQTGREDEALELLLEASPLAEAWGAPTWLAYVYAQLAALGESTGHGPDLSDELRSGTVFVRVETCLAWHEAGVDGQLELAQELVHDFALHLPDEWREPYWLHSPAAVLLRRALRAEDPDTLHGTVAED
ncbi:MAG: hypothetical protein AAF533_28030, partial [Acidobacteriota bacterium]